MTILSRSADLRLPKLLRDARTAGLVKLRCGIGTTDGRQVWARRAVIGPTKNRDLNVRDLRIVLKKSA